MSALLRVCRLWERTSRLGDTYYVGRVGDCRVVVLKRRSRTDDGPSDHDYELCVSKASNLSQPSTETPARAANQGTLEGVDPPQHLPAAPSRSRPYRRPAGRPGGMKTHKIDDDPIPF